jgi:arylsulfatase A-like enzyme
MKHLQTIFPLAISLIAATCPVTGEIADKPNIIVIFTDDQTFRAIGYENPEVKTPQLDALSAGGVRFRNCYVASPICAASRAAMMTGRFPQQNGVVALDAQAFAPYRNDGDKSNQSLAKRLATAGYHTALFGKSHLGAPKTYGFETGAEVPGADDVETFRQTTAFIESQVGSEKPFFLWLAPRQPHVPLFPEKQWLDLYPAGSITLPENFRSAPTGASLNNQGTPAGRMFRDSDYRHNHGGLSAGPPRDEATMLAFTRIHHAVVSRLDDQVGRLAGLLRETGLMENTIVFFLSDNGYHLGSHGLGNKITMHEESVRVPCFAFGAGVSRGKESRALVSSLDIYPTLLELAGADAPPEPMMGKSLLPLLRETEAPHREVVFSECVGVKGKPGEGHRMARNHRWKLVLSDADEEFLFDQQTDPLELHNRIADPEQAAVLDSLRTALAGWMKEIGDRPYPNRAAAAAD